MTHRILPPRRLLVLAALVALLLGADGLTRTHADDGPVPAAHAPAASAIPTGGAAPTARPAASARAAAATAPVDAAFLGDSYTYGVGASQPSHGYAYLVARAERWSADVVGLPGSGYVRIARHDDKRIDAGIATIIAARPRVVIVECGRNDAVPGIDVSRVRPNALRDLRRLRAALPDATLVVLGPVWLSGHPSKQALAVRADVHAVQRQIPRSLWIDPIAEKWFTGRLGRRTGDDATMINYRVGHPNDAGYGHIARRLKADLRALAVH